jgi:hypothetical protein
MQALMQDMDAFNPFPKKKKKPDYMGAIDPVL